MSEVEKAEEKTKTLPVNISAELLDEFAQVLKETGYEGGLNKEIEDAIRFRCRELKERLEPTHDVELVFRVRDKPDYPCAIKSLGFRFQAYANNVICVKPASRGDVTEGWITIDVKEFIAKQSWEESTKKITVDRYTCFLTMLGLTWDPPIYKPRESLPFIPFEEEIDSLIASCGKKMATFLQGLKETGADPGELLAVRWIDVNTKNKTIAINHPVKGHNPRILPISDKLIDMLQRLPKHHERVFGGATTRDMCCNLYSQRKTASMKLANPRLKEITFTALRHWKGTMEYHKTKDILHVKKVLGHKKSNQQ